MHLYNPINLPKLSRLEKALLGASLQELTNRNEFLIRLHQLLQ